MIFYFNYEILFKLFIFMPNSSYGDGAFLLVQTAVIGALILHYGGAPQKAGLFLGVVAGKVLLLNI